MRIAVLMSTYNGDKYIDEQIASILQQKGNFEIQVIVRDDGSTDTTLECLKKYETIIIDSSITENLGPAKSFIYLLKNYPGYDYYAFCDQDDVWYENKLETAISHLSAYSNSALFCSNALLVDKDLNEIGGNVYKKTPKIDFYTLSCAGGLLGCTMVFNSQLAHIIRIKEMPKDIVMHDFYIALICSSLGGNIIYHPYPLIKYRQHGNNTVGVSYGFISKIKHRINDILSKPKVSISNQASSIVALYFSEVPLEKVVWLQTISKYRNSFLSRVSLSASLKTKYINLNMSLKNRLAILFGNR